jgi:hypothetical protein
MKQRLDVVRRTEKLVLRLRDFNMRKLEGVTPVTHSAHRNLFSDAHQDHEYLCRT